MATQRYISTSFWDDPWVQTLSSTEKFLYMYLLTNPLTNIAGIYEVANRRIAFDTGLNYPQIEKALAKFQKSNKAVRIKTWIILPTWPRHQKWEKSDRIKTGIDAILKTLPECIINTLESVSYQYPIDRVSIPYAYTVNYTDTDTDLDTDTDTDLDTQKPRVNFVKPTAEEVAEYAAEIKFKIDANFFLDHYESNGWMVGKTKMKNWKATVRKWKTRNSDFQKQQPDKDNGLKLFGSTQ